VDGHDYQSDNVKEHEENLSPEIGWTNSLSQVRVAWLLKEVVWVLKRLSGI